MKYNKAIIIFTSITILLIISGFSLLLISSLKTKNYFDKYKVFEQTDAEVINYIKKDNDKKSIIVEYKVNQESYLLESNVFHKYPEKIGTKVEIAYNPNEPSESIWLPLNENTIKNYILIIVSLIIIISSIFVALFDYKLIKNNTLLEYIKQENGFYNDKTIVKEITEYEASI